VDEIERIFVNVTGRILDEKGAPVSDIMIYVDDENVGNTNSTGEFGIEVEVGKRNVFFQSSELGEMELEIEVLENEDQMLGDIIFEQIDEDRNSLSIKSIVTLVVMAAFILMLVILAFHVVRLNLDEERKRKMKE
jgi:hypothetical protein